MRIAVCRPQVPFARGGAEIFTDTLVDELRARGHEADLVSVPFKWYPGTRVLTQAFLWRMLDLEEADGRRIDMVVATKFPSYLVRHAEKRVWLVHQFRQAYELDGTPLAQFGDSPEDRALRRKVQELDRVALGEATRLFTTSRNVASRLEASTGLAAEVLPHPPQELDYRCTGYENFVLSVNRLDRAKRIDLAIAARARDAGLSPGPIRHTSRRTPSGESLTWALLGIGGHRLGGAVPFFIDWLDCTHPSTTAPRVGDARFEVSLPPGSREARVLDPAPENVTIVAGNPGIALRFDSPRGEIAWSEASPAGFSL